MTRSCLLFVLTLAAQPAAAQSPRSPPVDTIRTTLLMSGRPAGIHKAWVAPDGSRNFYFEFNDRGRGPALSERVVLDGDGYPVSLAISGHVLLGGFMDSPGPFAGPTKVLVSSADRARAWVDRYADQGYAQIKVYCSLDPALVPVIVAERFTAPAERAALLDLASEPVRRFIQLLRDRGIVIDPTLAVFEGMLVGRPEVVDPAYAAVADRLPPNVRRGFLTGGLAVPDAMDQRRSTPPD